MRRLRKTPVDWLAFETGVSLVCAQAGYATPKPAKRSAERLAPSISLPSCTFIPSVLFATQTMFVRVAAPAVSHGFTPSDDAQSRKSFSCRLAYGSAIGRQPPAQWVECAARLIYYFLAVKSALQLHIHIFKSNLQQKKPGRNIF